MNVEELIKQLSKFPADMQVVILDVNKNAKAAADQPSDEGAYTDIEVSTNLTDEELQLAKEDFPEVEKCVSLEFVTE